MTGSTTPAPAPALRALVVDDEPPARDELSYLLSRDPRIGWVSAVGNASQALRLLEREQFDVIFSDVRMPGLDGLDLARVLARFVHRPAVVFVTAYDDTAVEAFDLAVADYVMKPVRPMRLAEAVRRVMAPANVPVHDAAPDDETIAVELAGVTRFVRRSEVHWVEAQGDYARLHTATGSHLVRISLSTLESRWASAGFTRIHRSTLVSLRHVRGIRSEAGHCTVLVDGTELPVSRRSTRQLRELLLGREGAQER